MAAAQLDDGVTGPLQKSGGRVSGCQESAIVAPARSTESAASLPDLTETSDNFFKALGKLKATEHMICHGAARLVECASHAIGDRASFLLEDQNAL